MRTITHVMRAPVVGGSELETLAIVRNVRNFAHRVVFPRRFAGWEPSIRSRFPADVPVEAVEDLDAELRRASGPVHIQFPFLLAREPVGHDTVLELAELPPVPTAFTVHAAVNVPVLADLEYVFHTAELAARFPAIEPVRRTVCPSLVEPAVDDRPRRRRGEPVRILWVSRNEEGKFHDAVPSICERVLERLPAAELRFVGVPARFALPEHPRLSAIPCPAADLAGEYRRADLLWYFPHERLEETWCRVVTEALGHGLPCVVSDRGAMRFQVAHGGGVAVSGADACVDAIVEFAEDAELRRAHGEIGRRSARLWFDEAKATIGELYERLCEHAT